MDDIAQAIRRDTGRLNPGNVKDDGVYEGADKFNAARDLDKLPVQIRPAEHQDIPMIYDSWLNSYAGQNKDQPRWSVFPMQRTIVRRLLKVGVTLIAAGNNLESQDDIYSWACAERSPTHGKLVLHFAFTKMLFRRRGLFAALLKGFDHKRGEPIYCSHRGFILKEIRNRYNTHYVPQLQFDWGMEQFERCYGMVSGKGKKK